VDTENNFYDLSYEEHCNLANLLSYAKGKWLLTYNEHALIRRLYKGYKISRVSVAANAAKACNEKRAKLTHLIIKNY